jgi:hypothetical protein
MSRVFDRPNWYAPQVLQRYAYHHHRRRPRGA